MKYQLLQGNNVATLKTFPDNHFDSIVTDPPYGIDFLGKSWDSDTGSVETYQECLRVLKPGGHILAFSAARTYHHLATTIERAGFEIRDQIMWIYSSGFPKSQDIGKSIQRSLGVKETKTIKALNGYAKEQTAHGAQRVGDVTKDDYEKEITQTVITDSEAQAWSGWGTQLKPAHEPIVMARKPSETKKKGRLGPLYTPGQGNPKITACEVCGAGNGVLKASKCQQDPCPFKEIARPADNEWAGWGTQLKPAHEPIVMARKPIKLSIAQNCQAHGVGALNIDATRIAYDDPAEAEADAKWRAKWAKHNVAGPVFQDQDIEQVRKKQKKSDYEKLKSLKVPAKVVLDQANSEVIGKDEHEDRGIWEASSIGRFPSNVIGEIPDYQKYFYCPKVSRKERHVGFDTANIPQIGSTHPDDVKRHPLWDPSIGGDAARLKQKIINSGQYNGNNHPTVKPIELMKYLIRLITPAGGRVLDPFNGSGSTGCAAVELDYDYTGLELDPAYVEISRQRIEAWYRTTHKNNFNQLFTTDDN